ncbi:MAG: hypothetical protein ACM3SW_03335 [Actinomycetota bacterium]
MKPASEPGPAPASGDPAATLGQVPSGGRRSGPLVILVLVLLIVLCGVALWLRPSSTKPGQVIILTPETSMVTVEPGATIQLGVAAQGDGGSGMSWKIQENYGGTVEPAGVTLRGAETIYKARYHAGETPGDYHVVATSVANKQSLVTIAVHVER